MGPIGTFCYTNFNIPTIVLVLLSVFVKYGCAEGSKDLLPLMNAEEIIRHWGYEPETHMVTTEDGYILQQHRIGHGKGRPVIIQHGLLGASDCYILRGPKQDFAFLLAEAGYDVWLSNVRGTVYGRQHVHLSLDDEQFWDFTWHEMGYYDLPAIVDYVLNKTEHSKVMYVGHSLGTIMSYILGSTRPEYNQKFSLVFSWAPVAFMSNIAIRYWVLPFAETANNIRMELRKQGIHGIFPRKPWMSRFMAAFCERNNFQGICLSAIFSITGFNKQQIDPEIAPRYFGHYPAGSSTKIFEHAAQMILSGYFRMYDHGNTTNMEVYGRQTPPSYNISLISFPVSLHHSQNDFMSSVKDVEHLASMLPNVVGKFIVSDRKFNHFDFVWARDARKLVYDQMFAVMKKYGIAE